ncbi:MAG: hypothetical protein QOG63_3032, partial [Thermoleophilaceae bacterium]|nr:hypothetical protein [Thermoleophilaceae bacterium]
MRPGLIALGVAVLAALAGCGSDSGSSSGGTALERSLGSVKAGPASKAYVEWGDTARLADLAHLPPDGGGSSPDDRFLRVAGAGFGNLGTTSDQLPKLLGIHPFGADTAITVGTPPRVATRLAGSGLAASAAEAKLRAAGAKPTTVGGRELLALGEEGNAGTDRLDDFGLGLGRDFDRVAIGSDSIATGAYAEPVLELMGGAPSLGDDPTYAAGASCLGDVSYAILSTAIEDSHLADIPGSPALVAIGGRISPAKAVDEV